jgi:hypothetical protein
MSRHNMEMTVTEFSPKRCVVRNCPFKPVATDYKRYTVNSPLAEEEGYFDHEVLDGGRDIWYCQEHAKSILFPIIDIAAGNTTREILQDFAADDMM